MKNFLLILLGLSIILHALYANAQKKHQFGVGLDFNIYMSTPKDWQGREKVKYGLFGKSSLSTKYEQYLSIHYIYNNKWHFGAMMQYYHRNSERQGLPEGYFDSLLAERSLFNVDILVGADILRFWDFTSGFLKNSSLIAQVGPRFIGPNYTGYTFIRKGVMFPDMHPIEFHDDYSFSPTKITVRFAFHISYNYKIYKGLYANANLNYAYIFVEGSPVIGQVGLRYRF